MALSGFLVSQQIYKKLYVVQLCVFKLDHIPRYNYCKSSQRCRMCCMTYWQCWVRQIPDKLLEYSWRMHLADSAEGLVALKWGRVVGGSEGIRSEYAERWMIIACCCRVLCCVFICSCYSLTVCHHHTLRETWALSEHLKCLSKNQS